MAFSMTASGLGFDPEDPQPDAILIEDIAHALSNICRFGGHTGSFYSVAQHSVLVSKQFTDAKLARVALMHDASEAYIGDVIRPVKKRLGLAYSVIEDMVMETIAKKFGFEWPMPPEIKAADELLISTEFRDLMHHRPEWSMCGTNDVLEHTIVPLAPKDAELEFLFRFDALFGQQEFDFGPQLTKALIGRDEAMAKPNPPAHTRGRDQWFQEAGLETPKSSSSEKHRPTTKSGKASRSSAKQAKNSTSSSKRRTSKGRKSTSRTRARNK